MGPRFSSAGRAGLDPVFIELLAAVGRAHLGYYAPLSAESCTHEQLCHLESLGYIRYCRYPEEFWVILPAGKEFLSKLSREL